MNLIVGTSFYVDPFIPEDVKLLSVEEVIDTITKKRTTIENSYYRVCVVFLDV